MSCQALAGDITHAGFEFSNVVYYKPVWSDAASLAKLGAALPQEITITNVFGAQAKIQTDGCWKYDEAKSCWYNSAVNAQLPQLFTEVAARCHYPILPMLILLAAFSYTRPVKPNEPAPADGGKGASHAG